MTIIGNQSSSELTSRWIPGVPPEVGFASVGPLSVGFDFCLVSVSAHIKAPQAGGQAGLGLTVGFSQPPPFTASYPFSTSGIDISVVFGVTVNEFYPAGSNYVLGIDLLGGGSFQLQGDPGNTGVWDIWGDAQPAPVPATPAAPTIAPLSMTSWSVTWTKPDFTSSTAVQRSSDNGASWSTVASGLTGTTFTDTGVPSGPLRYRVVASNTQGSSTSPATIAEAPAQPGAPILTETLQ